MNLKEQTVCEILTLIILGSYTQKPILYKKINSIFFYKVANTILNFIGCYKRPEMVKGILRKNKVRGMTFCDLKIYYKAIVIETVCNTIKHTHRDGRT